MDAISGIYSGPAAGATPTSQYPLTPADDTSGLSQLKGAGNITMASLSSTSISATSETLIANLGGMGNKDLVAAVLLMLTLELLKSEDPEEKKQLLAAIAALAQQGGDSGGTMLYSASSLSIESTQLQVLSIDTGGYSYGGNLQSYSQAAGPGSVNTVA